MPVVPVLPAIPRAATAKNQPHRDSVGAASNASRVLPGSEVGDSDGRRASTVAVPEVTVSQDNETALVAAETSKPVPPPPPKSWADLVRKNAHPTVSGTAPTPLANGLGPAKNETLSDVLNTIGAGMAESSSRIAFLQPRGLVNTGNMCYMNSVCFCFENLPLFTDGC